MFVGETPVLPLFFGPCRHGVSGPMFWSESLQSRAWRVLSDSTKKGPFPVGWRDQMCALVGGFLPNKNHKKPVRPPPHTQSRRPPRLHLGPTTSRRTAGARKAPHRAAAGLVGGLGHGVLEKVAFGFGDGLQPKSDGLQPSSDGLQPQSDGLQPST